MKEKSKRPKTYFQCPECQLYYPKKTLAQKCEQFCCEHHSCNLEITKHAVSLEK